MEQHQKYTNIRLLLPQKDMERVNLSSINIYRTELMRLAATMLLA